MAEDTDTDVPSIETYSRRSYLSGIGGGGLLLGTSALLFGARGSDATEEPVALEETGGFQADEPEAVQDPDVIDLGEEGLDPGDEIDGYLSEYFESGEDVLIPAGEYEWTGEGLGGTYEDATLVGAGEPGAVELRVPDGTDRYNAIQADGGEVRIENITLRGATGGDTSKVRVDALDPDATLVFDTFWLPDGVEEGSEGNGIYVGKEHSGVVKFVDCWIEGFADNGLYASAPGTDDSEAGDGPVIVDGGLYRNNNISNVRIGSSESVVRGATLVQDDIAPDNGGSINQRNLRIRQPGDDLLVQSCDIYHEIENTHPVDFSSQFSGGSGRIRATRIHTESDESAVNDHDGDWSANRLHITGDGDDTVDIPADNVCQDGSCQRATPTAAEPIGDR